MLARRMMMVPGGPGVETLITPTNMTSDSVPSPFVTSTDNLNAGFRPYRACDGSNGNPSYITNASNTAAYWRIDLGDANKVAAIKYAITEIDSVQWAAGTRHPDAWTFRGSTDNFASSNDVLDTRSSIAPVAANNRVEYSFSNATVYRYYQISMNSAGPGNLLGFARFEIFYLA